MNIEALYQIYLQHPHIQTDTRKIQPGELFFALKGDNFNGNAFAEQALSAGAAYAIVDEPVNSSDTRILHTDDVLSTLQTLARHHRQQLNIPFIAITGSNGKTTTKELVHAVLSSQYITYTTSGNFNNHIGIPLTLLKVRADAQMAVIEMGANHQREIAGYCTYALPTHGLITNCGKAHLEGFGGVEGVRKGKGELYDHLRATGGTAFVMWDYDYLREMSNGIKAIIRYGTADADIIGHLLQSEPFLQVQLGDATVLQTQLVGAYNLPNVLAAIAIGHHFNVPVEKMVQAIESYSPSNSRSQLVESGSNKIILDAYNANPSSMKLAIENFAAIKADKKILMLGAMAELGEESLDEHRALVSLIEQYSWEKVVLVGGDFGKLSHPYLYFDHSSAAQAWYREQGFDHCYILVKGSRSMQMEKVVG
jgi:UDP-N-acetylmuramoyl-tripeptide--D-alanyl-D-alanine ligase